MQIKILDKDFYKSASYLRCPQELNAQIYEAIHGLASMLDCVDDLDLSDRCKNQIKKYKDYPQCKLWVGYEKELIEYIRCHLLAWNFKYEMGISYENYMILFKKVFFDSLEFHAYLKDFKIPDWITDEVIQMHRSVLIQKEIEREKKLKDEIEYLEDAGMYDEPDIEIKKMFTNEIKNNLRKLKDSEHYRNLWPDCPRDLKMRYDFRKGLQNG